MEAWVVAEIAEFTSSGEIAVAQSTGQFGVLALDDAYQGTGIGRKLIRFVEHK